MLVCAPRTTLVCVHGNIAVGKSTLLSVFKDTVSVPEPISAWGQHLQRYYDALVESPSRAQQEDIVAFEEVVVKCRLEQYSSLNGEGIYVFERSLKEMYYTFVQVLLQSYVSEPDLQQRLVSLFEDAMKKEKFDQNIYLRENTDTIMARIKARGRVEEQGITREYIQRLQDLYDDFVQ